MTYLICFLTVCYPVIKSNRKKMYKPLATYKSYRLDINQKHLTITCDSISPGKTAEAVFEIF